MTDAESQAKWRRKNRFVKRQLNVMAVTQTHDALDELANRFGLRGKGESVAFACYVARALLHRAGYDDDAAALLGDIAESYHRDRDMFAP
jgi:hypothetical protein